MNYISKELLQEIKKCQKCKTIIGYKKFPPSSHGKMNSQYLLVSEAPGKKSIEYKDGPKYWMGAGGKLLRQCASVANTTLEDIFYLTDIVKCWPNENNENRTPFNSEMTNCSPFLLKEIDELKPKLVVAFGSVASSFLLDRDVKIKFEHGSLFKYSSHSKLLVLLHPSGIDRHMDRKIYIKQITDLLLRLKDGRHKNICNQ